VHAHTWISQSDAVAQRPWMVISVEEDAMTRVRSLLSSEEALYESLCRMTPEALRDALGQSWSRVYTMTEGRSIGIISANQTDKSAQQNVAARYELTREKKRFGFGHAHVRGIELRNPRETTTEPALLLIGAKGEDRALKSFLIRNGRKYQQISVLYKSGTSDRVTGIFLPDGIEEDWGIWQPGLSPAFLMAGTVVYTRPFSFSTRGESLI